MQPSPPVMTPAQKLDQLTDFRAGFYACLSGWGDALFGRTTTAPVAQTCKPRPADGQVPLLPLDAGYDPAGRSDGLAGVRAQILVRIRSHRVFFTDPPDRPPHPERAGRPRRHGRRFKLSDDKTAPKPDAQVRLEDPRYGKVRLRAWHNLHPRLHRRGRWASYTPPPIVPGSVIRVDVERLPKPSSRANNKTLWLWWSGPGQPDPDTCLHAYLHRFDLEHTYRFAKNTLGWTTPSLRTPQQADRWTWLTIAAYTQLRLARGLVNDIRLPWERPRHPKKLTPARVRTAPPSPRATTGTPSTHRNP